jgi:protein-ribulosamine 3-kinase
MENSNRRMRLAELIAEATGSAFSAVGEERACGGGCIHHAQRVRLEDGREFFVKSNRRAAGMFEQERAGLEALYRAGTLRVPMSVAQGKLSDNEDCLILEYISPRSPSTDFFARLGTQLAELHRSQTSCQFGWPQDNYLGSSLQRNPLTQDWAEFFAQHRLRHQLQLARRAGNGSQELFQLTERLCDRLERVLGTDGEPACLLHGDLWSGNFMSDEQGQPVVFDPAVYYGHREAEMAMPLLFGGFGSDFFSAYHEAWPLQAGWRDRVEIYKLYHLLNHLNLFGAGYLESCLEIVRRFA